MEYSTQVKLSKTNTVTFRQFSSDSEQFIIMRQKEFGYKSCFNTVHSLQVSQSALQIDEGRYWLGNDCSRQTQNLLSTQ